MSNIKIKVNFYDSKQRDLIKKNFPEDYKILKEYENKIVEIPIEDFKTYSFFKDQFTENGKTETFIDLKKMNKSWIYYEKYFDIKKNGLVISKAPSVDRTDISETIGVAGGLSVASIIYGFTQADWIKIPPTKNKDFDFNHESCLSNRFIIIEAKGSIVTDNSKKPASVSNHKNGILRKKSSAEFKKKYKKKRDTFIGIITVADKEHRLQAWLVDPEIEDSSLNPEKIKLLKRLYFYYSLLHLISKRSYYTLTLAGRIKVIEQLEDFHRLDKVPLVNYNFKKLILSQNFINSRSRDKSNKIIGVARIIEDHIYFLGISVETLKIIINQSFKVISTIKEVPNTQLTTLFCKISKSKTNSRLLEKNAKIKIVGPEGLDTTDNKYILLEMEIELMKNSSGLFFGRLPLH